MKKEKIILVLNGNLPKKNDLFAFLNKYDKIFCADGAANQVINSAIEPDYILGDLDSIKKNNIKNNIKKIIKLPNQNFNDLQKILLWLINKKYQKIDIIGIDGKRLDHTLGNFSIVMQELIYFDLTIFTKSGIFYTVQKSRIFKECKNKYFSIFNPKNNDNKINTFGLEYELENRILKDFQEGTLNIANKNQVTIKTDQNILVFISNRSKNN